MLPAAVAALAVTRAAPDPDRAGQAVERLLAAHYLLEALCPLARCAPTPKPVAPGLQRIADTLQQWQQAVEAAVSDIHELDPDEDSTSGPVAAQIEAALAANDWRPLAADRAQQGFPMNLLGNEPLMRVCANTSPRH